MSPAILLWLISGSLMLQPLSTDMYLASLPHLAAYFAVTPAAVLQTLSLFVIGLGTAQLVSGPLSDRYGRRPVMLGGLLVYVLASGACALAPSMPALVLGRFIQAVGCCTAMVASRAIIRDAYEPGEGAKVIAKASTLLAIAPLLGPILGSHLQVLFGWRATFVFVALFAAALAWATGRWLRETNLQPNPLATRVDGLARIYKAIGASPAFWAYALPGALSYASIFVFISGTPFVLIKALGVPTALFGYCFAFGVSGYLAGTLVCHKLLGRIGLERTLGIGTTLALAAAALFAVLATAGLHHWAVVVGSQFLVMAAHGINFPCAQAGAVAPFPEQAGAAAGLLGFLTMAAAFLAGSWVGVSHDGTLLPLAWASLTMGLALFACARLFARHRPLRPA
jgi:DHA1 family bicyclomycin/chloramphenicol resistance-like MFS transporter